MKQTNFRSQNESFLPVKKINKSTYSYLIGRYILMPLTSVTLIVLETAVKTLEQRKKKHTSTNQNGRIVFFPEKFDHITF